MATFNVSASAEKKNISQAIRDKNRTFEATIGESYLEKIPQIVEDLVDGFPETAVVAVTASGTLDDSRLSVAVNVNVNPTGVMV